MPKAPALGHKGTSGSFDLHVVSVARGKFYIRRTIIDPVKFAVMATFYTSSSDSTKKNDTLESPTQTDKIDSNKVIIEDWVERDDKVVPEGFSKVKKKKNLKSVKFAEPLETKPVSEPSHVKKLVIGANGIPKYRDGNAQHHRASSESLLAEEQPSWLDELLNEPESPVQRGHRRSSSDSFTYLEVANAATTEYAVKDEQRMRNMNSAPSWASQDFLYKQPNFMNKSKIPHNAHSSGTTSSFDNLGLRRTVSLGAQELNGIASTISEKQEATEFGSQESVETCAQDANTFSERKMSSNTRDSSSELDIKHAKH
ncbi:Basic-leucine zipper domain-containing protein [Artemisia annua]|uniref:Basic-leucine zipper domain-containing protein n=1 Tax=Artemisia annua TaxID=35608 RepID=A0A2U1NDY7_ARTAN|nr:Basic-leucine zipper domain-containing protein [Artemisia annua]